MSTPFFVTFGDREEIHDVFPKVFSVFWVVFEKGVIVCTLVVDVDDVEGEGVV